jgi:hypothetical protein
MIPALMGRKKAVGLILGGMGDKPKEKESEGDDLKMVAQDLIRAVESKDASAASDALRAAYHCIGAEEDKSEEG